MIKIPIELAMKKDICSTEKLLLGAISMSQGEEHLSDKFLSEMLGIGIRTVKENLMRLEDKGYINRLHIGKQRVLRIIRTLG